MLKVLTMTKHGLEMTIRVHEPTVEEIESLKQLHRETKVADVRSRCDGPSDCEFELQRRGILLAESKAMEKVWP
jgi:hypothetical protein